MGLFVCWGLLRAANPRFCGLECFFETLKKGPSPLALLWICWICPGFLKNLDDIGLLISSVGEFEKLVLLWGHGAVFVDCRCLMLLSF